jgi:hypothetical protein
MEVAMAKAKAKGMKVPVSVRAVIQRINRKLKPDLEALKISRSARMRSQAGQYYIIDYRMNAITNLDVDPEKWARDLGVLADWEAVAD